MTVANEIWGNLDELRTINLSDLLDDIQNIKDKLIGNVVGLSDHIFPPSSKFKEEAAKVTEKLTKYDEHLVDLNDGDHFRKKKIQSLPSA